MTSTYSDRNAVFRTNLNNHTIIGEVFSRLQDGHEITGLIPLDFGLRSNAWYILAGRKSGAMCIGDFLFYTFSEDRKASERSIVTEIIGGLQERFGSGIRAVKLITPGDVGKTVGGSNNPAISMDVSAGTLNFTGGSTEGFEAVMKLASAEVPRMINFPSPYHPDLDPLIRSLFLTRNLLLMQPINRNLIVTHSLNDAYENSIGIRKDQIKRDFQDLLKNIVGAGIFKSRGQYLYYPANFDEYRRRFIKRYYNYMEKISKTTIFDYDTLSGK